MFPRTNSSSPTAPEIVSQPARPLLVFFFAFEGRNELSADLAPNNTNSDPKKQKSFLSSSEENKQKKSFSLHKKTHTQNENTIITLTRPTWAIAEPAFPQYDTIVGAFLSRQNKAYRPASLPKNPLALINCTSPTRSSRYRTPPKHLNRSIKQRSGGKNRQAGRRAQTPHTRHTSHASALPALFPTEDEDFLFLSFIFSSSVHRPQKTCHPPSQSSQKPRYIRTPGQISQANKCKPPSCMCCM